MGGFALGLERAGGFETVAFCEIEEFPQKVLKKHWPNVPIFNDVRTLEYDGSVDIITAGYPCQPDSNARVHKNQITGTDDSRWLWPEVDRLLAKYRPAWFIGENVFNHINMGLDKVLYDLESQGYATRAFIISAACVGANHKRQRIWILAYANGIGRHSLEDGWKEGCPGINFQNMEQRCVYRPDSLSVHMGTRYSKPRSGLCRNDDGVSEGMDRLKGLGNAVLPQIPEIIGRAIILSNFEHRIMQ